MQETKLGKNTSSGEEKVENVAKEKARETPGKKSGAKAAKKAVAAENDGGRGGSNAKNAVKKQAGKDKKQNEKSAAKKRVELALKKEERKAEKQKAKSERAKKRAEARAARKEKRLAAKEERRKKRLEGKQHRKEREIAMKEKRAAAKAERKAMQAKRRAEREKRRAMLKSETREARAKRLAKEKEARIAAKKERREKRYRLKLQRRDAALKRKQQRLEARERRRSENHAPGFGGWLAAVISLGVVTLALGTVVTMGAVRMNQADMALSTGYRGALYELTGTISDVDGDLAKARVASGRQTQSELFTDLLVKTRLAESTLEKFPVDQETDMNMTAFLNRTGDVAQKILEKLRAGEKLTENDYKTIENLYAVNQKILAELTALTEELSDKDMAMFMKDKAGNKVYEHFRNIEDYALEGGANEGNEGGIAATNGYPSGKSSKKHGAKQGVSSAQAEEACRKYFADYNIAEIMYSGETESEEIDAFNFSMTDAQGKRLYAEIAKENGALVGFDYFADCSAKNFDLENALTIAENYLNFLGYENMTAVWVSESGVNATFLFVYENDGVAYYPDSVSVKVCEERGKAVGFTAVNYLNNHARRGELPALTAAAETDGAPEGAVAGAEVLTTAKKQPKIAKSAKPEKPEKPAKPEIVSEETAEKALNNKLTVISSRKAVIKKGDRERLCYEFACNFGEDGYFIYVDAFSGEEIQVNRVLTTAQGQYLR